MKLQDQKRDFTRTRLIEAALDVFSSAGYGAAKVDDIASAAGCSRATFYLHFNSKASVMIAFLERALPEVVDGVRKFGESVEAGMSKQELRAEMSRHLYALASQPGAVNAVHVAVLTDPAVGEWFEANRERAIDFIEPVTVGSASEERSRIRARIIILSAMTLAAFDLEKRHEAFVSENDVLDYLTDLWADLLFR